MLENLGGMTEIIEANFSQIKVILQKYKEEVIDAITQKWVWNWQKKQFKGKKNQDLWMRYLNLHDNFKLSFVWVKGHAGHPENERCDELAFKSASENPTNIDDVFESEGGNDTLF